MWHVLHLIARPFEVLLGVFCVLTAIVLYPGEEGKIQSKFEDFWISVDDYQQLALSKHAAFMTHVAQLETRFLDRVFGHRLLSVRSIVVSVGCSCFSSFFIYPVAFVREPNDYAGMAAFDAQFRTMISAFFWGLLIIVAVTTIVAKPGTDRAWGAGFALFLLCFLVIALWQHVISVMPIMILVGSFLSDVMFVVVTRRFLQLAGNMTSFRAVASVIVLNIVLAVLLVGPAVVLYVALQKQEAIGNVLVYCGFIAMTNVFDVILAVVFVVLSSVLIVHRVLWPLLTRTLFRMADIGTKGRRAILTTVGLALIAAGVTGKVPELMAKMIEKFSS